MRTWIILCVKGGRVASVENNPENLKELQRQFYLIELFKNQDGTIYYSVIGVKKS